MKAAFNFFVLLSVLAFVLCSLNLMAGSYTESQDQTDLDERVKNFLERNNYTKALEIGTSTGHSGIWIAWALSKTGGKLTTIEINERRYREALKNFEEAGLSGYIDARLADAHELVRELKGPFDFVFCDADKNWYKKYAIDVLPKLEVGGCFTAHNVSGGRMAGIKEFLDYLDSRPELETTIDRTSRSGISISFKRAKN
jgi:predicted O-methyltransferase YrrM